jgi:hypothetical protein
MSVARWAGLLTLLAACSRTTTHNTSTATPEVLPVAPRGNDGSCFRETFYPD